MDNHVFSEALDYVDLNITRAVLASQLPAVQAYHRRVFGPIAGRQQAPAVFCVIVALPAVLCVLSLHVSGPSSCSSLAHSCLYSRFAPGLTANHRDDSYLLWDAVDAPLAECSQATYNLHVVTQLGWPGKVGCKVAAASACSGTKLECAALNDMQLDVTVRRT